MVKLIHSHLVRCVGARLVQAIYSIFFGQPFRSHIAGLQCVEGSVTKAPQGSVTSSCTGHVNRKAVKLYLVDTCHYNAVFLLPACDVPRSLEQTEQYFIYRWTCRKSLVTRLLGSVESPPASISSPRLRQNPRIEMALMAAHRMS
jgi:hypothetical protein